jgi:hypothetical protein
LPIRVRDASFRHDGIHIITDGFTVFRLAPGRCDHPLVRSECLHGGIEGRPADAFGLRIGPQLSKKSRNRLFLGARWRRQDRHYGRDNQAKSDEHDD